MEWTTYQMDRCTEYVHIEFLNGEFECEKVDDKLIIKFPEFRHYIWEEVWVRVVGNFFTNSCDFPKVDTQFLVRVTEPLA